MELLNREDYRDAHLYIQYNETGEAGEPITDWAHDDRLLATLYSDGMCLPGGKEAFEQDEGYALLFLGNLEQPEVRDELAGFYIRVHENRYITVFSN